MFDVNEVLLLSPSKETERKWYLNSKVRCSSCKKIRKVKNCKRYIETESWEMSHIEYEVCVCPKCGNDMEEL